MAKHYAFSFTVNIVVVAMTIFSSQAVSVLGQTGTATGGHDEIVKRLQEKLAGFKSASLSEEMGTVLSETGEADLGAKLVEAFLGSVGKVNQAITGNKRVVDLTAQNYEKNIEKLKSLDDLLDEIDQKAVLIQTYYDALSPDARNAWRSTASPRMNNGTKPTIDALKSLGLECPANQIDQHRSMSFVSFDQVKKILSNYQNLENQLQNADDDLKKSRTSSYSDGYSSSYDSYGGSYSSSSDYPSGSSYSSSSDYSSSSSYSSSGDSYQPPPKPVVLTWVQQVEALVTGETVTFQQVKPLCDLLASTMDGMVKNKRNELAQLRRPVGRGAGMTGPYGSGSDPYYDSSSNYGSSYPSSDSYGSGYSSGSSGFSPSFRPNTVAPVAQVNVAGLLNKEIRYFMGKNLKQMFLSASGNDRETLLKAWCAVCEAGSSVNSSWDVYTLVTADVTLSPATRTSAQGPPGSSGSMYPGYPGSSGSMTPTPSSSPPMTPPMSPSGGPPGSPGSSSMYPPGSPGSMSSSSGSPAARGPVTVQGIAAKTRYEMLSVMSGYRSDLRVLFKAVDSATIDADLAIQMCFNLGKPVVPLIKLVLTGQSATSPVRVALIEATQYIGDPDAAAFLLPLLASSDTAIVTASADAIAAVGDRRASAALVKGLGNPQLADTIVSILKRMGNNSSQDIIPLFKEGNPATDKFCVDVLTESGDINTLYYLAAILERYHSAPAKKDMPQAEKSELLMLTMRAGTSVISRNMGKAPPTLTVPTVVIEGGTAQLDYTPSVTFVGGQAGMGPGMGLGPGMSLSMPPGMGPGMSSSMPPGMGSGMSSSMSGMSSGPPGSRGPDGTSGTATVATLEQFKMAGGMLPEDIQNNAPYEWLDRIYIVAAKHINDTATLMKDVQTDRSGDKIGRDIRNERIDKEFFRTVINTSEEGLSAYLTSSKSDVRKLKDQKDRVSRALDAHQLQLNRMNQRKPTYDAFIKASTGVDPSVSGTSTGMPGSGYGSGPGGGTIRPATTNPLGGRL